jgi:signal peptidase I
MKKSYIKILGLEFLMIAAIIINVALVKNFQITNFLSVAMWLLTNFILYVLVGLEKDKSLYKTDTTQIIFVYTFLYFTFIYFIGLFVGFNHTPYSLVPMNILKNLVPLIIIIILQEIFRYNIVRKCENKTIIAIMIAIFILLDIMFNIGHYSWNTALDVFEVIGTLILPSIVNNIVLTFIAKKSGYYPTVVFRLLYEGLIYVVPIYPDLNIYLSSVFKIIFPTILFLKFNIMYAKNTFIKSRQDTNELGINAIFGVLAAVIIILVSGAFQYYAIAIGSNSMYPKIKKGDSVIIYKSKDESKLKKGVIIAYRHNKVVIIHRIYKIETINNKIIITTKGDNNLNEDNWDVLPSDVIGIVKLKIPIIGWPSVWLSENFWKKG